MYEFRTVSRMINLNDSHYPNSTFSIQIINVDVNFHNCGVAFTLDKACLSLSNLLHLEKADTIREATCTDHASNQTQRSLTPLIQKVYVRYTSLNMDTVFCIHFL